MSRDRSAPISGTCRHRHWLSLLALAGVLVAPTFCQAAPFWSPPRPNASGDVDASYYSELQTTQPGTSEAAVRDQAVNSLPLHELPVAARGKAQEVLSGLALFRRLPTLQFAVDSSVYQYLIQHPDVAVSSWRAMEISKFELKQAGANLFHADAQDGSVGSVEVWKSTPHETLIYCDGAFKSPLVVRPIQAKSIMRLRTRYFLAEDGTPHVEHQGDVFVAFPSLTVETVAKLISPVSHMIADRNFRQLTLYVHLMSTAMSQRPEWVDAIVRRMDVSEPRKRELLQLTENVRVATERRTAAALQNGQPAVVPRGVPLEAGVPGSTTRR